MLLLFMKVVYMKDYTDGKHTLNWCQGISDERVYPAHSCLC